MPWSVVTLKRPFEYVNSNVSESATCVRGSGDAVFLQDLVLVQIEARFKRARLQLFHNNKRATLGTRSRCNRPLGIVGMHRVAYKGGALARAAALRGRIDD